MTQGYWTGLTQACFGAELDACTGVGTGDLPSVYAVSDFAVDTVGLAGAALARAMGQGPEEVRVDHRLASLWFDMTVTPQGWQAPSVWDAIAGVYETADGWIRLHTNAPHHRRAALSVLGCDPERAIVADHVRTWRGAALEQAVVDAKGCAAVLRSADAWRAHAQGQAVAQEPLIQWDEAEPVPLRQLDQAAPLAGVRVLDLTRVLAGPVATRFLAGYGADVLRIDPPFWNEPAAELEVTLGKRCAGLDLREAEDRAVLKRLIGQADIMVHGYRSDALEGIGFGADVRRALNPALIDVGLNAYGWTGPWRARRGFDSLVQMSCGIAARGQQVCGADGPKPLPVQALDHGTGYVMAAAAIEAWRLRCVQGRVRAARLSLARTAHLLMSLETDYDAQGWTGLAESDLAAEVEHTSWGPARRVRAPLSVCGADPVWPGAAGRLRRHDPRFV